MISKTTISLDIFAGKMSGDPAIPIGNLRKEYFPHGKDDGEDFGHIRIQSNGVKVKGCGKSETL